MRYAVIRENDSLSHAQHAGYYSPNNGSGNDYRRDRYLFQGVFRVENHGDAEIDLINSRDNTQARTKVPGRIIESGKTAIVNYLVRKSNSRASIDAGQARLAADAIERYIQSHFNTELHHSDDVIETDDYLEHAQKIDGKKQYYYTGKCRAYTTQQGFNRVSMSFMSKQGKGFELIIDVKPNDPNETINSIRLKAEQFLRLYHRDEYFNNQIPNNQIWKACEDALKELKRNQQHTGYYSPNLLGHSYTVIPADDELYHFGTMGMKWGVRRYQNEDGSLTEEGKKRYTKKDGSYIDNESRQAIKKEISKRKGMAGASSVLGSALISSVILNPAVLAMPVAGLVLPTAIAAASVASFINNFKSMQLSQIKDRADMIDFHRSGNEPTEPIRVNVRRR